LCFVDLGLSFMADLGESDTVGFFYGAILLFGGFVLGFCFCLLFLVLGFEHVVLGLP
jgi:hypothetical protein